MHAVLHCVRGVCVQVAVEVKMKSGHRSKFLAMMAELRDGSAVLEGGGGDSNSVSGSTPLVHQQPPVPSLSSAARAPSTTAPAPEAIDDTTTPRAAEEAAATISDARSEWYGQRRPPEPRIEA